ncbi:MAG: ABC transporter permease [Candidatus Brocadiia bacterium]
MRRVDGPKLLLLFLTWAMAAIVVFALGSIVLTPSPAGLVKALLSREMAYALTFTVATALLSTALVMVLVIPVAYTLSRVRFRGSRLVRTVLYLPMALPQIVLGLCLLLLFGAPPVAQALRALGVEVVFTRAGVVVAQTFIAFPYALRVLKATFDSIDPRLEFVSRSLGCSRLETFRRVSLPLARTGLLASGAIAFARCVGAFGSVLVLAGGMRMNTETLPIAIHLSLAYGNLEMAMAAGLLLIVLSSIGIYSVELMGGRP